MAKKSLKERIFFLESLEERRQKIHNRLKNRIAIRVKTIRFLASGFSSKEHYFDAVSGGFYNLKDFQTKTGFKQYTTYKKKMASGFSTKLEWEEANSKGFETKAEFDLGINENFTNKDELVTHYIGFLEDQKKENGLVESEIISFQKLTSTEYNKQQLHDYKSELLKRKAELEEKSEIIDKLQVINQEDFSLLLVIFENKRLQLLEMNTKLLDGIEKRFPYLDKWHRILDVINSFRSHVPVQMDRIAELSKLSEEETEPLLNEIVVELPSLGEYLQLEQVFIKKTKSEDELSDLIEGMRSRQIVLESKITETNCLHCQSKLEIRQKNSQHNCPNCNQTVPICPICRGYLYDRDEILIEENCGNYFHKRHIIEWVNVQGKCPVCRTRVNEKSLKSYEKSRN
ncbi:MAG: RING finger domain-containing protein [Candidatus Heimdallarchaeaceae archaeon]|jgi:predicted RNA-binding Zn-ribbon protein involved in translation (DUF1610 family)